MPSLSEFFSSICSDPLLALTMALVAATIFVNGSTDAANSIADAVGTRSISFYNAVILAVVCNFVGLVAATLVSTAVADTISGMVDFGGDNHAALVSLAAAMVAIVVWAGVAWMFGIPTSESHALIAGLSGAAIAVSGGPSGINMSEWSKVLYGLVFSTTLGFALGFVSTKAIREIFAYSNNLKMRHVFGNVQVIGAGFGAFMHGAQDGQKFMSTATLAVMLATGKDVSDVHSYPMWLMVACALIMAVGTAVGGKKIVKTVGTQMVPMEKYQGAAASMSDGFSLLLSTLFGMPVSTTHTKSSAIMGAGAAKSVRSVNWGIAKDIVLTWVLTFPGCGLLGFALAWVFLHVF
ncbi:MAG: inorganic phosphate transporter [Atopobiaceae bacterium]|nr:inorganic phosphate transporter [Atopobiaceae bacterium]